MRLGLIEIALFQSILYLGLWIIDDYIASLLSIIIPMILLGVLVISCIAEWIEPSKVPKKFFWGIGMSIIIPLVSFLIYSLVGGDVTWMND